MPEITGIKELLDELKKREKTVPPSAETIVGFTQSYAIYVHENLKAKHRVGQAKFLEEPARELRRTLAKIVVTAVEKGAGIQEALDLAALRLQREAQKKTPVDTGALKNSAFIAHKDDLEEVARRAYEASERIRQAELDRRKKTKRKKTKRKRRRSR